MKDVFCGRLLTLLIAGVLCKAPRIVWRQLFVSSGILRSRLGLF